MTVWYRDGGGRGGGLRGWRCWRESLRGAITAEEGAGGVEKAGECPGWARRCCRRGGGAQGLKEADE